MVLFTSLVCLQFVAAFAVSAVASQWERTGKPFNPLLGETYEMMRYEITYRRQRDLSPSPALIRPNFLTFAWRCAPPREEEGYRLISEQVSHHPPVSAFHAQSLKQEFEFHGSIYPKLKFWGKSVEAEPKGTMTLELLKWVWMSRPAHSLRLTCGALCAFFATCSRCSADLNSSTRTHEFGKPEKK